MSSAGTTLDSGRIVRAENCLNSVVEFLQLTVGAMNRPPHMEHGHNILAPIVLDPITLARRVTIFYGGRSLYHFATRTVNQLGVAAADRNGYNLVLVASHWRPVDILNDRCM